MLQFSKVYINPLIEIWDILCTSGKFGIMGLKRKKENATSVRVYHHGCINIHSKYLAFWPLGKKLSFYPDDSARGKHDWVSRMDRGYPLGNMNERHNTELNKLAIRLTFPWYKVNCGHLIVVRKERSWGSPERWGLLWTSSTDFIQF